MLFRSLSGNHNMIEISGYSFVGEETLNKLGVNNDTELRLRNPLSQEQDRLRRSLVPNVVNAITLNSRHSDEFSIYELGRVYVKDKRLSSDLAKEKTMLTGAVYRRKPATPLFYEAKRIARGVAEKLQIADCRLVPEDKALPPYAHPVRSMAMIVDGQKIGRASCRERV